MTDLIKLLYTNNKVLLLAPHLLPDIALNMCCARLIHVYHKFTICLGVWSLMENIKLLLHLSDLVIFVH